MLKYGHGTGDLFGVDATTRVVYAPLFETRVRDLPTVVSFLAFFATLGGLADGSAIYIYHGASRGRPRGYGRLGYAVRDPQRWEANAAQFCLGTLCYFCVRTFAKSAICFWGCLLAGPSASSAALSARALSI
jgi:hypothetical protein